MTPGDLFETAVALVEQLAEESVRKSDQWMILYEQEQETIWAGQKAGPFPDTIRYSNLAPMACDRVLDAMKILAHAAGQEARVRDIFASLASSHLAVAKRMLAKCPEPPA